MGGFHPIDKTAHRLIGGFVIVHLPSAALGIPSVIISGILSLIAVRFSAASLSQFNECHSHSLIANSLRCLLSSVALTHFESSVSEMYITRRVKPPTIKPEVNAIVAIQIVSMALVYHSPEGKSPPVT